MVRLVCQRIHLDFNILLMKLHSPPEPGGFLLASAADTSCAAFSNPPPVSGRERKGRPRIKVTIPSRSFLHARSPLELLSDRDGVELAVRLDHPRIDLRRMYPDSFSGSSSASAVDLPGHTSSSLSPSTISSMYQCPFAETT